MGKFYSKYILKLICCCLLVVGSAFLFTSKSQAHDGPGRIDLVEINGEYHLDQSALDHFFSRVNSLALKNLSPEKLFQYILSKPAYAQAGGGGCTMSPPPGLTGHPNSYGGVTGATGHFGDWRKTRYHKGFDLYHDFPNPTTKEGPTILGPMIGGQQCHPVRPPAGSNINSRGAPRCNPPPNPKGTQYIWNDNPNGYGYYLVFDCSHITGGNFKVRYAHIAGYSEATYSAITGRTAVCNTNPHIHLEMSIDGTFVDPECVYGQPNRSRAGKRGAHKPPCPHTGPPNLCDAQVREALRTDCVHVKMDASNCRSKIPNSGTPTPVGTPTNPIPVTGNTTSTQPSNGEGDGDTNPTQSVEYTTPFIGDPATEIDTDGDRITDTPGIDTDGDGYADTPVTPPPPPPADNPGTPGGDPDLVPQPPPGKGPKGLSGCATDTWTAMVNQAVMEARREDLLNKRFIVKPDSVLDYGCFDMMKKSVADNAGPIFSETKKWANLPVDIIGKVIIIQRELGSKSLDAAIYSIVDSALARYKSGQFNNQFLAGSTPVSGGAGQSSCNVMDQVWKAAKCKNFDDTKVFYRFEDLINQDPREYPENMKCD